MVNLDQSIEELALSVRANRVLKNNYIDTIRQVVLTTDDQLLRLPDCGRKTVEEIREVVEHWIAEQPQWVPTVFPVPPEPDVSVKLLAKVVERLDWMNTNLYTMNENLKRIWRQMGGGP